MADMHLPSGHPPVKQGKIGVLLINLGTPDGTDYGSMRRYLSEFLSDPRVIEVPQPIWQLILQGPILTFRPSKSGRAYKKVWMEDGSPLLFYTRAQAEKLNQRIGSDSLIVDFAMNYGNPSIKSKIDALKDQGCTRILTVPLYPQYSATTTASVNDRTFKALMKLRWQPALRTTPAFHDDPNYIDALCASLKDSLSKLDFEPDVLLMSYHGIPKSYFDKGDPYHCHCHKTTRLVREKMGWDENFIRTTFQSRFGPQEWLQPYTDKTLEALPEDGVKKVAVAAPAFISDCLETLEEIAMEGRDSFLEAGGEKFASLPCLNDSDIAVDLLETLVKRELGGWL
ncbi:ferrochelatase [Ponticaulis sp.]|uniref:ferrochelatase n=1 Tax=Ponticaulis sp. TaxID=2020902 RepID=UPI000B7355E7|nr:ferrochelatase [Ponticaulis sp.]MAJ08959.1 ferrochelatase [Ponticaulis sp.]RPG16754.1 MAG: ferrochelatase [Hyphomonadaceae bacterium TMED125]HBH88528.1 ferrochelatase [Hyphomonadaceae bacterium]|tara:strand:- start:5192 stop:6211 length:1020 start_codon:yes stop_codon:yes gene_type:complete